MCIIVEIVKWTYLCKIDIQLPMFKKSHIQLENETVIISAIITQITFLMSFNSYCVLSGSVKVHNGEVRIMTQNAVMQNSDSE